jgi:hypothetical protein
LTVAPTTGADGHPKGRPVSDRDDPGAKRPDDLRSWLDERIEAAGKVLTRTAGGASLCLLDRGGRVAGGAKYEEGRFTALRDCRSALAQAPASEDTGALRAHLEGVRGRWLKMLDRYRDRSVPALEWLAYAQGGHDGCTEVLQFLRRAARRAAREREERT